MLDNAEASSNIGAHSLYVKAEKKDRRKANVLYLSFFPAFLVAA